MKAAIYCRVSTDSQELEGTSLDSQLEACLKKAQELGYETDRDYAISETYSGLTLDRPKLSQLRQWARDREIDAVIAYTLDRLSRDPVHLIILQDELERAGVELLMATETVDSSDMGKLIVHIKGFAAKLEAERIRERTMRGIRERVKAGKLPSGSRGRLYGYEYLQSEGKRRINEAEAKWVRQIFDWFVKEGLTLNGIVYRLMSLELCSPKGYKTWGGGTLHSILRNRAYIGQTFVNTQTRIEARRHNKPIRKNKLTLTKFKPMEEWIEIPNCTPPIVSKEVFEQAQIRLKRNKELASRNTKREYLLRGYMLCRCGRHFVGQTRVNTSKRGIKNYHRYYRCSRSSDVGLPCRNRTWSANYLEGLVWEQIEKLLSNPRLILAELERRKNEPAQIDYLDQELKGVIRRLQALDKEQEQLLQWALKGFPEVTVVGENKRINQERANFNKRKAELEAKIEQAKQAEDNMADIERFCELARQNLANFTFENKRLALEALNIRVHLDGDSIRVEGAIPITDGAIESTPPQPITS